MNTQPSHSHSCHIAWVRFAKVLGSLGVKSTTTFLTAFKKQITLAQNLKSSSCCNCYYANGAVYSPIRALRLLHQSSIGHTNTHLSPRWIWSTCQMLDQPYCCSSWAMQRTNWDARGCNRQPFSQEEMASFKVAYISGHNCTSLKLRWFSCRTALYF